MRMSGKEFRRIRNAMGLSQEKLAILMGVGGGSRTVRRWETEERKISLVVAYRIESLARNRRIKLEGDIEEEGNE